MTGDQVRMIANLRVRTRLSAKFLATGLLLGYLVGLQSALGRASERASGGAVASPLCIAVPEFEPGERCVLSTVHQNFRISIDLDGRISIVFETSAGAEWDPAFVFVQNHLRYLTSEGFMTHEEALHIEAELSAYDGAFYQLPNTEDLKMSLGFSPAVALQAEDHPELMRVHMQLALSLSPETATYLSELLGIEPVRAAPMAAEGSEAAAL
jgi:hypothetical protein